MSERTMHYGLEKPLPNEYYDVAVQNGNMDKIDEALDNIASKASVILVGPAEMVEQLPPGGLLLITDDGDIADYNLTLQDLLLEGDKAYAGEGDALETMLTVGRVRNLNLRKDESGGYYAEEDLPSLAQAIREMCAAAQEGGVYVADGATALSWWQMQYYIVYAALVSHQEALAKNWLWARTAQSALAALEARVSNLEGTVGDVNETLDEVNRGLST